MLEAILTEVVSSVSDPSDPRKRYFEPHPTSLPTNMRCGFDRLAERVRAVIGENPHSGHLFVFRSRRGDRLKILVWDRDGFVLWYKRLSRRAGSVSGRPVRRR